MLPQPSECVWNFWMCELCLSLVSLVEPFQLYSEDEASSDCTVWEPFAFVFYERDINKLPFFLKRKVKICS